MSDDRRVECRHGNLRRKCETCDLEAENAEMRRVLGYVREWTMLGGRQKCPRNGLADTYGNGMTQAQREVGVLLNRLAVERMSEGRMDDDVKHIERAKEIVRIVSRWWCAHVRQGMCDRCQADRVLDVEDQIRKEVEAALAAKDAEIESLQAAWDSLADYSDAAKEDLRAELEKARGLLGEARKWIATPSAHASLYQDIDAFLAGEET